MADRAALEDLAAECLARMESEGSAAVEAMCATHPEQAQALRQVIGRLSRVGLTAPLEPAAEPTQLGEYRILRRLGSGGMGVVYLAEQPRLGRKVALKVLRGGALLQPRARERFRREVEAISRLDHPNLCTVYDAGEVEGTPYLAMRPVEGSSLAELLDRLRAEKGDTSKRAPTTVTGSRDALLAMLEKVARALHAAHEAGVVHRDVKPGNVLIDKDGEPIVVDFGLVRGEADAAPLTQTGDQLGTPSYMAPEQIEPQIGAIDRRTDVYALGVLAHECLTLRLPYEATARDALYRRILEGDAPEPRALDRRIAPELSLVVRRAMDREPARRLATAAELADEIERVRTHRPIVSRRPAVHRRAWQWCLRNRVAATFLVSLGAGLVASSVLLLTLQRALGRADAALAVNAIRQLATASPERAFLAARDLLERDPLPAHASLVQEIMGELHLEAELRVGSVHQMLVPSPAGGAFAVHDADRRVVLASFAGTTPARSVGPWASLGGVCFDEAGSVLAVGTVDAEVHLVACDGRQATRKLPTGPIRGRSPGFVSMSWRAGRLLGVHGRRGWHVWDASGALLCSPALVGFEAMIGALSPDGRYAVVGEQVLYDASSRLIIHDLDGDRWSVVNGLVGYCSALAVTHDRCAAALSGQLLVTTLEGRSLRRLVAGNGEFLSVAFDSRGGRLAASDSDGGIRVLTADGGSLHYAQAPASVTHVAWSADGHRLATACFDGTVRVFDVDRDGLVEAAVLRGHGNGVSRVAFDAAHPDRVLSCAWDGTVRAWRLRPVAVRTAALRQPGVSHVISLQDGRIVGTGAKGDVHVWDAQLRPLATVDARQRWGTGRLTHPRVSPDGAEIALGAGSGPCLAWQPRTQAQPSPLPVRTQRPVLPVEPLGSGRYATIVYEPQRPCLATARPGDARWQPWLPFPVVHWAQVMGFAFAAKLDRLVTVDGEFTPRIWALGDDRLHLLTTLPRRTGGHAVFSGDGEILFSGSEDGVVRRWDLRTMAEAPPLLPLRGHEGNVRALALSPDERRLLTASSDKTLRLWDATTGAELMVLRGHQRNVTGCCFTADGKRALSASADGTVREWWLTVDDIRRAASAVRVRGE